MTQANASHSSTASGKGSILYMLFGFALVCSVNLLCFFPQTVLHSIDVFGFRLYNLSTSLALVFGSLLWAALALTRFRFIEKAMLISGYLLLASGCILSLFVWEGVDERLVVLTGVACGLGISTLMVCWFSFLAFVPERYAMLTQGGQAFLGSVFFIAISGLFAVHASVGALIALGVSAVFSVAVYRRGNAATPLFAPQGSLRKNLRTLWNKGNLSQSFTTSLLAFAVISLLYGIITAVIMSPETTIDALDQAVLGGIVGAVLFLAWAFLSKKRDYGVVLKGFFGVVAFILILPIEGHGSIMAAGYQLISLLFFSLVIDTFHANRRSLLLALSLSYALTRGLFLLGLYIPGYFGVSSYDQFFDSASLLVFLVYIVFMVLLFVLNRERKSLRQQISQGAERSGDGMRGQEPEVVHEAVRAGGVAFEGSSEGGSSGGAVLGGLGHGEREAGEDIANQQGADDRAVLGNLLAASESLGMKNGLTKRETEVLGFFSRGRDVAFISAELHLSRNTVKSYGKTIYAKLNVHSQQELIDAVEQEASSLA